MVTKLIKEEGNGVQIPSADGEEMPSFSSVLHAKLIRNLCNTMLVHEKDKDTPSSHNHAVFFLLLGKKRKHTHKKNQPNKTTTTTKNTYRSPFWPSLKSGEENAIESKLHVMRLEVT